VAGGVSQQTDGPAQETERWLGVAGVAGVARGSGGAHLTPDVVGLVGRGAEV
jgi:hypothetical protein